MKTPHVPAWVHRIWENPPDPIVYLFPGLADVDMRKIETKAMIIGITFLISTIVFSLSYLASFSFVTFRTKLRTKEKVFWCLSFVRAVFGFLASAFGFWYVAFDNTLQKDVVNGCSQSSFLAVYIAVGFFVFECIALFLSIALYGGFDLFLVAHHTLSLVGFGTVAYYESTHFFSVVGMLLEMTTPFSCFCWMLLKADMSRLSIWKANQLVLVHLFHSRTTIEGYFVYKMYMQWENIIHHMPGLILGILIVQLSLQFFVLTPYWTYKKMSQLFNPVDWNHPELQRQRNEMKNGHVTNGVTDGVPQVLTKKQKQSKKNK